MILIGINYKDAPINIREKFYFSSKDITALEKEHLKFPFLILSTCNRTEIYFEKPNLKPKSLKAEIDKVISILTDYKKLAKSEMIEFFYIFFNEKAISHLFEVAASLNSMIIGENQILGQLKKAYAFSSKGKMTPYFNKVFQEAIAAGKKIRTKTAIGKGGVSLGSLTVDMIKTIFKGEKKLKLLIFGQGKIAREVLKNIAKLEIETIYLITKSHRKKPSPAKQKNVKLVRLEDKMDFVREADIIVTAAAASEYVINHRECSNHLNNQFKLRLFIDLGVPRNIDPAINQMEDTLLYSLDDLRENINLNYSKRINEINQAKLIIYEHIDKLEKWRIKKSFFEIYLNVEKQIKSIDDERRERYLEKLVFFKKDLPENEAEYQKKINEIILFFLNENISLEINHKDTLLISNSFN